MSHNKSSLEKKKEGIIVILEKLRDLNENMLALHKNDKKKVKRQKEIQKLLQDERCFFKMTIEQSYAILRDLGIEEAALRPIYLELLVSEVQEETIEEN